MKKTLLYERLKTRNPQGLPYEEAVQIFLLIYCTTDYLPASLRHERYTKEVLVDIFETLERDGLILQPQATDKSGVIVSQETTKWSDVVGELLSNRIECDFSIRERVRKYL